MERLTTDALFDGQLLITQSKSGYRFSIDPVILAHFAAPEPGSKIIDIGTGCGVIPLILAYRQYDLWITGVEIQGSLARLADSNIIKNKKSDRISIVNMDMKDFAATHPGDFFDLVITNPPYTKKHTGRINPDSERAVARHELKITLSEILKAAAFMLLKKGRFFIIYPVERLDELLALMVEYKIFPKRIRLIYPKRNGSAKLVVVCGVKQDVDDLITEAPLYIYNLSGSYSYELEQMLS